MDRFSVKYSETLNPDPICHMRNQSGLRKYTDHVPKDTLFINFSAVLEDSDHQNPVDYI